MKKRENWVPKDDQEFSEYLIQLKEKRYALKEVRKKRVLKERIHPYLGEKKFCKKQMVVVMFVVLKFPVRR